MIILILPEKSIYTSPLKAKDFFLSSLQHSPTILLQGFINLIHVIPDSFLKIKMAIWKGDNKQKNTSIVKHNGYEIRVS